MLIKFEIIIKIKNICDERRAQAEIFSLSLIENNYNI